MQAISRIPQNSRPLLKKILDPLLSWKIQLELNVNKYPYLPSSAKLPLPAVEFASEAGAFHIRCPLPCWLVAKTDVSSFVRS